MTEQEPRIVDCEAKGPVQVTVTLPAVHLCPFRDETDEGTVTLTWTTSGGQTVELHSLREWVDSLDEWVVTHERYTEHLVRTLWDRGMVDVTVTSLWSTAGAQVIVTA